MLVTGGASGIGAATVRRFLADGDWVASLDLSTNAAGAETPTLAVTADVGNPESILPGIEEVATALGGLDVLVCSAGVDRPGSVETSTLEDWDYVFSVNLRGVFLCAKAAIPHLRAAGGGVIIIIASQMGLVAQPNMAAYCASKAGAIHLARAIVVDHALDGIRANAVCPGPTLTPLAEARWSLVGDLDVTRAAVAARQLHGRLTMPDEIAEAVWYLASPGAASVLGTALVVDGGYTAV